MSYNPVYNNTTNSDGERVSTNAYWTGHQIGTVMQDAQDESTTLPYAVELASVHVGAILQDAKDTNFPTLIVGD